MAKLLEVLNETRFSHRVPAGYPVTCPTLELTATWDATTSSLLIYRPSDQIVSRLHQNGRRGADPLQAEALSWRPDGGWLQDAGILTARL